MWRYPFTFDRHEDVSAGDAVQEYDCHEEEMSEPFLGPFANFVVKVECGFLALLEAGLGPVPGEIFEAAFEALELFQEVVGLGRKRRGRERVHVGRGGRPLRSSAAAVLRRVAVRGERRGGIEVGERLVLTRLRNLDLYPRPWAGCGTRLRRSSSRWRRHAEFELVLVRLPPSTALAITFSASRFLLSSNNIHTIESINIVWTRWLEYSAGKLIK